MLDKEKGIQTYHTEKHLDREAVTELIDSESVSSFVLLLSQPVNFQKKQCVGVYFWLNGSAY